jgi:hypothetical protein
MTNRLTLSQTSRKKLTKTTLKSLPILRKSYKLRNRRRTTLWWTKGRASCKPQDCRVVQVEVEVEVTRDGGGVEVVEAVAVVAVVAVTAAVVAVAAEVARFETNQNDPRSCVGSAAGGGTLELTVLIFADIDDRSEAKDLKHVAALLCLLPQGISVRSIRMRT